MLIFILLIDHKEMIIVRVCTCTHTHTHTHMHTYTHTNLSFWDSKLVPPLLGDRVAKNLLYIEALSSIALEHWEVGNDKLDNLSSMQKKALKKEVNLIFS